MDKPRFWTGIALGLALIIVSLILYALGYDAFFLMAGGIAGLAVTLNWRLQTGDQPEKDERTRKIWAFGAAYSYLISLIFAAIVFSANQLGLITMTTEEALAMTILVMTGSFLSISLFLSRRGDVE
jgi:hypothetical protein